MKHTITSRRGKEVDYFIGDMKQCLKLKKKLEKLGYKCEKINGETVGNTREKS